MEKSRENLYSCLVAIRDEVYRELQPQLTSIEQSKEQAIKEAHSMDECEFIYLCSEADKSDLFMNIEFESVSNYVNVR